MLCALILATSTLFLISSLSALAHTFLSEKPRADGTEPLVQRGGVEGFTFEGFKLYKAQWDPVNSNIKSEAHIKYRTCVLIGRERDL